MTIERNYRVLPPDESEERLLLALYRRVTLALAGADLLARVDAARRPRSLEDYLAQVQP